MSDSAYIKEMEDYLEGLRKSIAGLKLSTELEKAEQEHTRICVQSADRNNDNLARQIAASNDYIEILAAVDKQSTEVIKQNNLRQTNLEETLAKHEKELEVARESA